MKNTTLADCIARFIAEKNTPAVFQLSGGMIAFMIDAIGRLGKTPIINTRHEQAAGFSAEGSARISGIPGFAMGTSGPGATNLLTPIACCFSFRGAKLLVTGEGGMLVTNDSKLYEKARKDQEHGRRPGTFWIESLGHKYKMNNLTAAFGIGQLERVENQIERKRRIFDWYKENLSDLNCLSFQQPRLGSTSIHWMTSILVGQNSPVSREVLVAHPNKEGIDTRPVFPSISEYPIWGYKPEAPKVSPYIAKNGINLPSGVLLNRATIDRICNTIRQSLGV